MSVSFFSVSMAIDSLMSSVQNVEELNNRFQDNNIMIGMSTILSTLSDIKNNDNEAIMLLEPLKDTTPSFTDSEFTATITRVRRLISQAVRNKNAIKRKLNRLEKK